MLEVRGLGVAFPDRVRKPLFGPAPPKTVLRGIDLDIAPGEAVGVVGESGSGKTTLGRAVIRLLRPSAGSIRFEGRDITGLAEQELRPLRRHMQIVFQDPQSSLNPRHRIGGILARPLRAFGLAGSAGEARDAAVALLERVGLPADAALRYPHQLSGGQRQRVAIARAIGVGPRFVVADEIVSGLDVSVQAQILDLLRGLRDEMGLGLLFISHDLSVIRAVCDRVLVMLDGEAVEQGGCAEVFARPRHAYTRRLLDAIPLPEIEPGWLDRDDGADE